MTPIKKNIIAIGLVLVLFSLVALHYVGAFDKLSMTVRTTDAMHVIYLDHKGPYKDIRFVMRDVYRYCTDKLLMRPTKGIGIFFDNPGTVAQQDLHSQAGFVVYMQPVGVEAPYMTMTIDSMRAIVGEFPIRSMLSNFIGTQKFYSRLIGYSIRRHVSVGSPIMEVYDLDARKIVYIAPVKQPQ